MRRAVYTLLLVSESGMHPLPPIQQRLRQPAPRCHEPRRNRDRGRPGQFALSSPTSRGTRRYLAAQPSWLVVLAFRPPLRRRRATCDRQKETLADSVHPFDLR